MRVQKGTPSNPVFSFAPKNSEKSLLRLTALPAICLSYTFWHLPWGSYLSLAFLTNMKLCPSLLFFFPLNMSGRKKKKRFKKKTGKHFPCQHWKQDQKDSPMVNNLKHKARYTWSLTFQQRDAISVSIMHPQLIIWKECKTFEKLVTKTNIGVCHL